MAVTLAKRVVDGNLVDAPDLAEAANGGPATRAGAADASPAPSAPGEYVAIALEDPTDAELAAVAARFALPALAVEDAAHGHQRAKLERYDDVLFVVVRPAARPSPVERLRIGEVHAFLGEAFVVVVIRDNPYAGRYPQLALERLLRNRALAGGGPDAALYAMLDSTVDAYGPIADDLEDRIDDIETDLFAGRSGGSRRIFEHFTEVVDLQRATNALPDLVGALLAGADRYELDDDLRRRFEDVRDHAIRLTDRLGSFRSLLENALTVDATMVAQEQNDDMRRISAWAAIVAVPTVLASVYGMNFADMPGLRWWLGFPVMITIMAVTSVLLYLLFRARGWLGPRRAPGRSAWSEEDGTASTRRRPRPD